jgi:hypothetical protein
MEVSRPAFIDVRRQFVGRWRHPEGSAESATRPVLSSDASAASIVRARAREALCEIVVLDGPSVQSRAVDIQDAGDFSGAFALRAEALDDVAIFWPIFGRASFPAPLRG